MGIAKMSTDPAVVAAKKAAELAKKELAAAGEKLGRAAEKWADDMGKMGEAVVKDVETIASGTKKLFNRGAKDMGAGVGKTLESTPVNVAAGLSQVGAGVLITPFPGSKGLSKKLVDKGINNLEQAFRLKAVGNTIVGPGQTVLGAAEISVSAVPAIVALPVGAIEATFGTAWVTVANSPEIAGNMARVVGKSLKLTAKEIVVLEKELEYLLRNFAKQAKKEANGIKDFLVHLVKEYPITTSLVVAATLVAALKD
jgi:ElaB/YqjD/DUF883 family membrane-anchored ribosome-binding protein